MNILALYALKIKGEFFENQVKMPYASPPSQNKLNLSTVAGGLENSSI